MVLKYSGNEILPQRRKKAELSLNNVVLKEKKHLENQGVFLKFTLKQSSKPRCLSKKRDEPL